MESVLTVRREPVRSSQEMREAYNRLYVDPGTWLWRRHALARWTVRLIGPPLGALLLDVGCGDGTLLAVARSAGAVCYGVEISDRAASLACRQAGEGVAVTADGEVLPFPDRTFDVITSLGSLEHFVDVGRGVREMARVLKPGGTACVLVPNAFGLTWTVWHAWRTGRLADDEHQPIQRFATRCGWQRLLEGNGLKVQRTVGHEQPWPRAGREWRFYLSRPKEFLLLLFSPFVPLNLARCFLFLCTPIS